MCYVVCVCVCANGVSVWGVGVCVCAFVCVNAFVGHVFCVVVYFWCLLRCGFVCSLVRCGCIREDLDAFGTIWEAFGNIWDQLEAFDSIC